MTHLRVLNRDRNALLVDHGRVATSAWDRMVGLLRHTHLEPGEGLLLRGEQAIHTLGMRFPIDVAYLDRSCLILHLIPGMLPMRFGPFLWRAADVLEVPSGTFSLTGTRNGDRLEIQVM